MCSCLLHVHFVVDKTGYDFGGEDFTGPPMDDDHASDSDEDDMETKDKDTDKAGDTTTTDPVPVASADEEKDGQARSAAEPADAMSGNDKGLEATGTTCSFVQI